MSILILEMSEKQEDVVVGGKTADNPKIAIKHKSKFKFVYVIAFALLFCIIILLINSNMKSGIAFEINGKQYSKSDVKQMVEFVSSNNKETSQKDKEIIAKKIFDEYKNEEAAKIVKVVPSESELNNARKQFNSLNPRNETQKEYVRLLVFNEALVNAYTRYDVGSSEGYKFVFDFSKKILILPPGEAQREGAGDEVLIAQDRAYAETQVKKYYDKYKQGNITPNDLIAAINADKRINNNENSNQFSSKRGQSLKTQLLPLDIYNYVIAQTKPGLSSIRTGMSPTKLNATKGDYKEGFFYFVDIKSTGINIKDASSKVENEKKKLEAEYYGI